MFLHKLITISFSFAYLNREIRGVCHTKKSKPIQDVNKLFQEFWEWKLINNPEFATDIGMYQYDNRVSDKSKISYRRRASQLNRILQRLVHLKVFIDVKKHPTLALNMKLLENGLKQYLSGMKFSPYVWPINIGEGPQDTWGLLTSMRNNTTTEMSNIITRISLFSEQISEEIALMTDGIRMGQTLHRTSFEKLIPIFKKMGNTKVEESEFFKAFKIRPESITIGDWKKIIKTAKWSIAMHIQPAYRRLSNFLKETYLPKSRPLIGLSTVPNGFAFYQALLQYHTTTNLTPQEIHDIGLREVARITLRMENVKNLVKFNGTLEQFRHFLRTDAKFGFASEDEMLNYYKGLKERVMKALPMYFSIFPKTPFVIEPIPADIAPFESAGYYTPPTKNGPGIISINTYQPQIRRRYVAIPLFLHEALPGHHFQISLKIENGSTVLFRRYAGMDASYNTAPAQFPMDTAYGEGWGLYAEYLGEEMGMYKDPYDLFGRLSAEMLRACRLVVDTGMHVFRWSRTRAIDYLRSNTAEDLHDTVAEIDRYIATPGQSTAYKIGELKIKELRKLAKDKLGKRFNLRRFHDFVMSMGDIPLTILEEQTRLFIEREQLL